MEMEDTLTHEIELYPLESFKILLEHEVHRARRYKEPLTLIHLAVEADPLNPQTQHSAEVFAINVLNLHLRETDIPCREGNEFLTLIPSTDEQGGRIICDRLAKLFTVEPQTYDRVSFKLMAFVGMASLPGDRTTSSHKLMQNASQALQHARENRLKEAVIFSDLNR